MTAAAVIAALSLPAEARVDQRVPKKLLVESGAPTAANKRAINDGIEELWWLAALKPTTIGVAEYRDGVREYLEVAVLRLALRPGAKTGRLIELIHRAIPYPLLLIAEEGGVTSLSLAHKRWSQGEADKTVLDGEIIAVGWDDGLADALQRGFCQHLALGRQPRSSLYALYQGWMDTALALAAGQVTGVFALPTSPAQAAARRHALDEYARLAVEIVRLRAAAAKTKQMAQQVELNLEIRRLQTALAAAKAQME